MTKIKQKKFSTEVIEKAYKSLEINGSFESFIDAMIKEEQEINKNKKTK